MTSLDLAALHEKCFTTQRPWDASEFDALLATDSTVIISNPKGFALGRVAGPEAELLTLAVDPAHQRRGIARALMNEFIRLCLTKNATEIFLEVIETNTPAIVLYRSIGFKDAGYRKNYYSMKDGRKSNAHVLRYELA